MNKRANLSVREIMTLADGTVRLLLTDGRAVDITRPMVGYSIAIMHGAPPDVDTTEGSAHALDPRDVRALLPGARYAF